MDEPRPRHKYLPQREYLQTTMCKMKWPDEFADAGLLFVFRSLFLEHAAKLQAVIISAARS